MINNIHQAAANFFVYETFCSSNKKIPAAADTL